MKGLAMIASTMVLIAMGPPPAVTTHILLTRADSNREQ